MEFNPDTAGELLACFAAVRRFLSDGRFILDLWFSRVFKLFEFNYRIMQMKKAQTLKTLLERGCKCGANKPALVSEGTSYSFLTLKKRATKLGNGLRHLGLRKGDRVAVLSKNSTAVAESYMSVPLAGLVLVVLNYRFSPRELLTVLNDSTPSILLVSEEYLDIAEQLSDRLPYIKWFVLLGKRTKIADRWIDYSALFHKGAGMALSADVAEDDLAALMYTSGTTGSPKGCMITHGTCFMSVTACQLK